MDSLTQLALGASVSLAVMGRRTAAWKAALWGGVAGTLPDLDAFIDHGDAILNMVRHRAESHSLLYLALASGPMAWLVARLHAETPLWRRWWLALAMALVTHSLLDLMTVYGTQVWQPFTDEAYGVGSVFIIDPAYTLPLLLGVALALWRANAQGHRWNRCALVLSTLYLGWGMAAQAWASRMAQASLQAQGIAAERVLVTAAPLTTGLWRVVAMGPEHYHEGFYALMDGNRPIRFTAHPRGQALLAQQAHHPQVQRMARFSDGFFSLRQDGQGLWLTDLRMGQEPHYSFQFNIGPPLAEGETAPVATLRRMRIDLARGLHWLGRRLLGQDIPPPDATPPDATNP